MSMDLYHRLSGAQRAFASVPTETKEMKQILTLEFLDNPLDGARATRAGHGDVELVVMFRHCRIDGPNWLGMARKTVEVCESGGERDSAVRSRNDVRDVQRNTGGGSEAVFVLFVLKFAIVIIHT